MTCSHVEPGANLGRLLPLVIYNDLTIKRRVRSDGFTQYLLLPPLIAFYGDAFLACKVAEKEKFNPVENFLWGIVVESGKSMYFYI